MSPPRSDAAKHTGKLREFSLQLAERLKEAPQRATEPMRLGVRIGAAGYLVEMGNAGEIVAVPPIAPVPWTRPWYRGLANVRGRLIGVVDVMQLAGRGALPADQAQQLLVLGDAMNVNAALLVTRAFGLRNLKDLESLGAAADGAQAWEAGRYRDLDGTVLTELDLGRLVASDAFAAIGV
jgi:twitching motility protein PilI